VLYRSLSLLFTLKYQIFRFSGTEMHLPLSGQEKFNGFKAALVPSALEFRATISTSTFGRNNSGIRLIGQPPLKMHRID
jgi:hypothetical protein